MINILAYFQQVGGANALLPLFDKWKSRINITITGRSVVCDNLRRRNIDACCSSDMTRDRNGSISPENWINRMNPDIVITDTVNLSRIPEEENCCSLWEAARKREIPSVGYVDSWGMYKERFNISKKKDSQVLPDVIAVIDYAMKKSMLSLGIPETRLAILGSPRFELLYNQGIPVNQKIRDQFFKDNGLPPNSLMLTFVSEPIEKYHYPYAIEKWGFSEKTILSSVINNLNKAKTMHKKNLLLAVLIHPEEDEQGLRAVEDTLCPNFPIIYIKGSRALEIVSSSDLILGMFSMLLVEAVVLKRPVISLQMGLKHEDYLVTNLTGATLSVRHETEVFDVLSKAVTDPVYRNSLIQRQEQFKVISDACTRWEEKIDSLLHYKNAAN